MPESLTATDSPEAVTCYLASSGGPRARNIADQLVTALEDLNVTLMGSAIEESDTGLPQQWGQADFAVVVLTSNPEPNLAFEIGALLGSHTPSLLITTTELNLPLPLSELPRLTWSTEMEGLSFQLDSFIRSRVRKSRPPKPAPSSLAKTASEATRARSQDLQPTAAWFAYSHGTALAREVAGALSVAPFKTAPLEPLISPRGTSVFADVALWLPELEPLNPVILEVKDTNRPQGSAWNQLTALLSAAEMHLGLLVSKEILDEPQVRVHGDVAVVHVSLDALGDLSRKGPLRAALLRARNELVHPSGH
jgi:hypothetical protein